MYVLACITNTMMSSELIEGSENLRDTATFGPLYGYHSIRIVRLYTHIATVPRAHAIILTILY